MNLAVSELLSYLLKYLFKITSSPKALLIQSIKKLTQKRLCGNFVTKMGNYKSKSKNWLIVDCVDKIAFGGSEFCTNYGTLKKQTNQKLKWQIIN